MIWRKSLALSVMSAVAGVSLAVLGAAQVSPVRDALARRSVVVVAPISGTIDLGVAPFIQRVLRDAERDSVHTVVLDINTFGGRVDAAVLVRDALLSSNVRTVAFINRRAISAGALIAMATNTIAMTEGATIGAATPVQVSGSGTETKPTDEKSVSYVRKEFRSTAEARGRPPLIAEAMVDADVSIDGLIEKGKLLTLTTDEALTNEVAQIRAPTLSSLLEQLDLAGAEIRQAEVNWAEQFVRLLTNPVVSSLLLSVGLLGILVEIRTPGVGLPGIAGLTSLALFLGGHWIVQLAGFEELLLVLVGIVLVVVEVLVIPGFGIAGVAGIIALLAGVTMSLLGDGASMDAVGNALTRVAISLFIAIGLGLVLMRTMTRSPFARRLVLESDMDAQDGWESTPDADHQLMGVVGKTITQLRPSGIANLGGARVDVVSDGELIDPGTEVIVTRVDGNRVVVRRHLITTEAT